MVFWFVLQLWMMKSLIKLFDASFNDLMHLSSKHSTTHLQQRHKWITKQCLLDISEKYIFYYPQKYFIPINYNVWETKSCKSSLVIISQIHLLRRYIRPKKKSIHASTFCEIGIQWLWELQGSWGVLSLIITSSNIML